LKPAEVSVTIIQKILTEAKAHLALSFRVHQKHNLKAFDKEILLL